MTETTWAEANRKGPRQKRSAPEESTRYMDNEAGQEGRADKSRLVNELFPHVEKRDVGDCVTNP